MVKTWRPSPPHREKGQERNRQCHKKPIRKVENETFFLGYFPLVQLRNRAGRLVFPLPLYIKSGQSPGEVDAIRHLCIGEPAGMPGCLILLGLLFIPAPCFLFCSCAYRGNLFFFSFAVLAPQPTSYLGGSRTSPNAKENRVLYLTLSGKPSPGLRFLGDSANWEARTEHD